MKGKKFSSQETIHAFYDLAQYGEAEAKVPLLLGSSGRGMIPHKSTGKNMTIFFFFF